MRSLILMILAIGTVPLAWRPVLAQLPATRRAPEFAVEQQVRDRWLHGRQQARFSPFASNRSWHLIDSLRVGERDRRLYVTLSRGPSGGRDSAVVVFDRAGHILQLDLRTAPLLQLSMFPSDSARRAGERRQARVLAERRLRDLVPSFPAGSPGAGRSWTDTIAQREIDGPFRYALQGTRVSKILGDTVIGGRRLWIVRDSAAVTYEEGHLETESTLDAAVEVLRIATGTVRGVHLYDPALGLFRRRADTTRLHGEAVLRYPDGRSFRTPARYERTRRFDLFDSAAHSVRLAELRAADRRDFGGMVIVPANELQRRLSEGDEVARDSIIRVWRQTSDPDVASRLFLLLTRWSRSDQFAKRLDSLRIAVGDTAYFYQVLAKRASATPAPIDTADAKAMIAFMRDPSVAWGFNMSRDWLYENSIYALTNWPRAALGVDSATVSCTVAACRLLGEQWATAREPRLRDVGLVALMSVDPRRWADTVLAQYGARRPLLHTAAMLAKGVGVRATYPRPPNAPLPPPNSGWRAWVDWMNGVDSSMAAGGATPLAPNAIARAQFENSHYTAIRFYAARTGRDVVGELRRSYDAASSDSVRYLFAKMLLGLGELQFTEAEVAAAFTSGVPERVALAQRILVSQLGRPSEPAAAATAVPLLDRILAAAVDGTRLWRAGVLSTRGGIGNLPGVHGAVGRIFVESDSLPEVLRAKWGGRVEIISAAEWRRRDPRAGGVLYQLSPVRSWGRFARVELTISERRPRAAGEAPEEYAAGVTYYLMELNGEWVVVAQQEWIT